MQNRNVRSLALAALVAGLVGCASMTGKSASQNISDATISASVKTNLATERTRTLTAVDVDTVDGTVYLTGMVPDAETKKRAGEIANEVEGVRRVVNNLQTSSTAAGDAPDKPTGDEYMDEDDY
jgi:osmotically-inducible protein OsmY